MAGEFEQPAWIGFCAFLHSHLPGLRLGERSHMAPCFAPPGDHTRLLELRSHNPEDLLQPFDTFHIGQSAILDRADLAVARRTEIRKEVDEEDGGFVLRRAEERLRTRAMVLWSPVKALIQYGRLRILSGSYWIPVVADYHNKSAMSARRIKGAQQEIVCPRVDPNTEADTLAFSRCYELPSFFRSRHPSGAALSLYVDGRLVQRKQLVRRRSMEVSGQVRPGALPVPSPVGAQSGRDLSSRKEGTVSIKDLLDVRPIVYAVHDSYRIGHRATVPGAADSSRHPLKALPTRTGQYSHRDRSTGSDGQLTVQRDPWHRRLAPVRMLRKTARRVPLGFRRRRLHDLTTMAGGQFDSSKTRVAPVFDALACLGVADWPRGLLLLAEGRVSTIPDLNFAFQRGFWGNDEQGLEPPLSLLRWLVRNVQPRAGERSERELLFRRDAATIERALAELDAMTSWPGRKWYLFEGKTFPDALIETPDALIVVEGKRTEPAPTTHTTWMSRRDQIWRHIDAAWGVRGTRKVFGMFVVEGDDRGDVPAVWMEGLHAARSSEAIAASFPHRAGDEVRQLLECLVGITTWQKVCENFGLDFAMLPRTVAEVQPSGHRKKLA